MALSPLLHAQGTPATSEQSVKKQPVSAWVPLAIGLGLATSVGGLALTFDALEHRPNLVGARYAQVTGIGLGLSIGGAVLLILGALAGNGSLHYEQVSPDRLPVLPANNTGLPGLSQ